jgi:hypothetical protein
MLITKQAAKNPYERYLPKGTLHFPTFQRKRNESNRSWQPYTLCTWRKGNDLLHSTLANRSSVEVMLCTAEVSTSRFTIPSVYLLRFMLTSLIFAYETRWNAKLRRERKKNLRGRHKVSLHSSNFVQKGANLILMCLHNLANCRLP